MTPLPRPLTGTDPLAGFLNRLIRCVEERTIIAGENIELERTPQGTKIKMKAGTKDMWREMSVCYKEEGKEPREGFVMVPCSAIYFRDDNDNLVDKDGNPLA